MKMKNLAIGITVLLLAVSETASAQQQRRRTTTPQRQQPAQSGYGQQPSGYGTQQPQQTSAYGNNNQQQPSNVPQSGIPIRVVQNTGSSVLDTIKPSLRPDASIDNSFRIMDRKPLAYEHIREDDAVYRQRVWREIDTREKMNLPFRYAADEDNGNQRFISILIRAIRSREVTAFDPSDDRFTTPMTPDGVMKAFSGGLDTVPVYDMNGDIKEYQVRAREVDPDSIYRFRMKEEWVFDKESSRMFVRILGIAPLKRLTRSDGTDLDPGNPQFAPMFWVYYPDCRAVLSKFEAFNGKNFGARMTWEELFENRMFSSYIIKSTLDNPYDRSLRSYIKDPILRLLEGENIKEKIFNYEQDLWSY